MKLAKNKLQQAFDLMAKEANLLVPMKIEGVTKFAPWGAEGELAMDAVNTLLPPKDALFPQTEKMYKYKTRLTQVESLEEIKETDKQIIFGIRSCDMHSIDCMDEVFLTRGYVDSFYSRKKENLTTVAIGCTKVLPTCFCDSMGLNPVAAPTADVQLNDLGDYYAVKAQTEKGEALVNLLKPLLEEGDGEAAALECTLKVNMDGVQKKLMNVKMFESDIWQETAQKCIGCGTCTYVCPTCYCFDIEGKECGNEGYKFRCWDSCMFSEYTRMAGGHNPRPSKKERVRNRFLHKLAYFEDRYGKGSLCVGCGRCVADCPVDLDITMFIDKVGALKEAGSND